MNNKQKINNILKHAKGVVPKHCDNCGTKYSEKDFNLVGDDSQQASIHIHCHNCGNNYMLNVFNPIGGLIGSSRSQLHLDLSDSEELEKFAGSRSVSQDDALDAYNLLAKTEILEVYLKTLGDTTKALSEPQGPLPESAE